MTFARAIDATVFPRASPPRSRLLTARSSRTPPPRSLVRARFGCAARARLAFARPLLATSPRARDVARARTTRRCGREKRSPRPRTDSRARTTLAPRPGRLARLHANTTDDCGGRRRAAIDARVRLSDPVAFIGLIVYTYHSKYHNTSSKTNARTHAPASPPSSPPIGVPTVDRAIARCGPFVRWRSRGGACARDSSGSSRTRARVVRRSVRRDDARGERRRRRWTRAVVGGDGGRARARHHQRWETRRGDAARF